MSEITDQEVGEALGWKICHTQHSPTHRRTPYWDWDGGYMYPVDQFKPTTDLDDALMALEYTDATGREISEFIIDKKKQDD